MATKWYLLLPLAAAVMYAGAAVLLKEAERRGVGAMRITVLSNVALAAALLPLYPWRDVAHPLPAVVWPVLAAGTAYAVGQVLTIVAFARGEVSVATPALGTKALFAALVSAAALRSPAGGGVAPLTWGGAALLAVGRWLLVGRPAGAERRRVMIAVGCSVPAAAAYACFDVIIGAWSAPLGFRRLVPAAALVGAVLSLPLLRLDRGAGATDERPPRRHAGVPLGLGLGLLTGQSLLLMRSIALLRDATAANIVYASRGIWSVLLVGGGAALAQMRGLTGRAGADDTFARRLLGAGVMLAGVVLAFIA